MDFEDTLNSEKERDRQRQTDTETERDRIQRWFKQRGKGSEIHYLVMLLTFYCAQCKGYEEYFEQFPGVRYFILFLPPMFSFCSEQTTELFKDN